MLKSWPKKLLQSGLAVLVATLIVVAVAQAGSLTPSASPAATSYTLGDIYTRITTNATSTAGNHIFAPGGAPASTLHSLTDIYNAVPTIDPTKVITGTTYLGIAGSYNAANLAVGTVKGGVNFGTSSVGVYPSVTYPLPGAGTFTDLAGNGTSITSANGTVEWYKSDGTYQSSTLNFPATSSVCSNVTVNNVAGTLVIGSSSIDFNQNFCNTTGTLLGNLWNGTGQGITGGSQANGGVEDYNNGGSPPANRYATAWTQCTSGNSYCGKGDPRASAEDVATNLIWSYACAGSGCTSFSSSSPGTYSWDNSAANNNSSTASQLCSNNSGWSLPSQKQLMQAYIDGAYGNLVKINTNPIYWSATVLSNATNNGAWWMTMSVGWMLDDGVTKTAPYNVICVR